MPNDPETTAIPVTRLHPEAVLPQRMRLGDAAADLSSVESVTLAAGERAMVGTGVAVAIPPGMCGLVLPRSGLAAKHGITVLNSPGLIDSGYRGELKVILLNTAAEAFTIDVGERIAQLMVMDVPGIAYAVVDELPEAIDDRGAAGFGSSGRGGPGGGGAAQ